MKFFYPVQEGEYLTSPPGRHWNNNDNSIDMMLDIGTNLYAIASGEVVVARNYIPGPENTCGKVVSIKFNHPTYGDLFVTYMHMNDVFVSQGEQVAMGQLIGTSGNTKNTISSWSPHLHIQIQSGSPWYDDGDFGRPQHVRVNKIDGEIYRGNPDILPMTFTEKLFRYLEVQQGMSGGSNVPPSALNPVSSFADYYTKDYTMEEMMITDEDMSRFAQLAINELGLGLSVEENKMNLGVYAKLMRSMWYRHRQPGVSMFDTLRMYGGFSGWGSRGYPTLEQAGSSLEYLEIVKQNILCGGTYGLTGKYLQIARCYPIQNYGYGQWYGQSRSVEPELESRILSESIVSHITINSGHTCLIGCIANTGFFTNCELIDNISQFPENQLLINSANISGE